MTPTPCVSEHDLSIDIDRITDVIARAQLESGEIPWCPGDKTDPWDHVEAAMGLCIGGRLDAAARAYEWMARTQLADGSWYSAYRSGVPENRTRESHMAAYIAVGVYHYFLVTGDLDFLDTLWPTVSAAIAFAVGLQNRTGEIFWAVSPEGDVDRMALLTGCSSIYMSLKCALAAARRLGYAPHLWDEALVRLGKALQTRPHLFNMTKARYAMDWFYPVLSGAFTGDAATRRIDAHWRKFVIPDRGVRCVSDQPWVTVAETAELCLALSAMGNDALAGMVFGWIADKADADGAYWCGFTCPDLTVWPEERNTWTNGVVLMAADALRRLTPAARLFSHRFWNGP
ncbi:MULTISPECIES: hypothetical protein [Desulfococcus]|jgi:hypothetical protein|uniref:Prenyltransferase/squalene oxidase n=1 Tax=Desulfococcus multivorans DSM 2059 TaxID=1121405 RepID=S7V3L4_DESML|nr:hypothetical protein [Desulfococcus multivorans]AOY60333.1 conserved uncharacterized protein [Desulfococcus multivorans]AQV02438.1 phenyltransferase domain-containing protein [Desulfococcus multivorans]EPR41119.1 hypothetical protein dsmv_2234 [Desulfococcus multivorans DSM 2059]MDX9818890.1 phenyltransferase domain-containing protein [Desulfococcus multivorans]SJZ59071.1 hypothetical protein SAMN02745446_01032 [Desulfococcus multivorans DSM 2059]